MTDELIETHMADYPYSTDGEPMTEGQIALVFAFVLIMVVFVGFIISMARDGR